MNEFNVAAPGVDVEQMLDGMSHRFLIYKLMTNEISEFGQDVEFFLTKE
jgi:hypothetical protein